MDLETIGTPRDIVIFIAGATFIFRELANFIQVTRAKENGGTHQDKMLNAVREVSAEVKENREKLALRLDALSRENAKQFHELEKLNARHESALMMLRTTQEAGNTIMREMVTFVKEMGLTAKNARSNRDADRS